MIYLFRTHYSIGKGIIQANDPGESTVPCLANICLKNEIKQCFVVDQSMAGIWPIYNSLKKAGVSLVFGLMLEFVNSGDDKESNASAHRNIIFAKDEAGYKQLIKISTKAHVDFFHEFPRLDYNYLHSIWSDSLVLAVPFYDGFVARNKLTENQCVPDYRQIKPTFFIEDNGLPFDAALKRATEQYAVGNSCETIAAQTVYYEKPEDSLVYYVRRCMNRSGGRQRTLEKPELPHFGSNQFCIHGTTEV